MNAPLANAGHPEARQAPPETDAQTRMLGEGYVHGNIVSDPELRFTGTGRPVVKIRVAYSQRVHDAEKDTWRDGPPEFYDVTIWGKQGERVAELLVKGDRIIAAGQWTERTWTGNDGETRKTVDLTAREIGPSMLFRDVLVTRPAKPAPDQT